MRDAPKVSGSYRSSYRRSRPRIALLRDARCIVLDIGLPRTLVRSSFQLEIVSRLTRPPFEHVAHRVHRSRSKPPTA
jgi:hypothetical protein